MEGEGRARGVGVHGRREESVDSRGATFVSEDWVGYWLLQLAVWV